MALKLPVLFQISIYDVLNIYNISDYTFFLVQSAGDAEYSDCISAEG